MKSAQLLFSVIFLLFTVGCGSHPNQSKHQEVKLKGLIFHFSPYQKKGSWVKNTNDFSVRIKNSYGTLTKTIFTLQPGATFDLGITDPSEQFYVYTMEDITICFVDCNQLEGNREWKISE